MPKKTPARKSKSVAAGTPTSKAKKTASAGATKSNAKKKSTRAAKTPLRSPKQIDDDKKRIVQMIEVLSREFPDAHCMLDHSSAFELLIATILAAQCTDAMVNQVTPDLFKNYPTPKDFVDAPPEALEKAIFKTGFYRNKTKSIQKCCQSLIDQHGGEVPSRMEELVKLGGVGRKTANCVRGVSFGIPGVVVDTHVRRLSRRMGYTDETNPDKIEQDLMKIAPEDEWTHMSHLFADLGRSYCDARKPQCEECPIMHLCPKILD